MIQDSAIVTIEGEQETAPKLWNGIIFNDLEWPLSQISRSWYHSTSNNWQMVQDRAIVTMAEQQKVVYGLSNGAIFNELERPLFQFSRSRCSLTLDISQTAKDMAIVARQVWLGLLDVSAALDCVDHCILLQPAMTWEKLWSNESCPAIDDVVPYWSDTASCMSRDTIQAATTVIRHSTGLGAWPVTLQYVYTRHQQSHRVL